MTFYFILFFSALQVQASIEHLVRQGLPDEGVMPWPANPVLKDPAELEEISNAIFQAASVHRIDPYLLIAIAFRESTFKSQSVGKIGERSIFQITEYTARQIQNRVDAMCSLESHLESAFCAAAWLAYWQRRCGSIEGAISIYASGKSCKPRTKRTEWIVQDRLAIAKALRSRVK